MYIIAFPFLDSGILQCDIEVIERGFKKLISQLKPVSSYCTMLRIDLTLLKGRNRFGYSDIDETY